MTTYFANQETYRERYASQYLPFFKMYGAKTMGGDTMERLNAIHIIP
jgi:hypothetical protein